MQTDSAHAAAPNPGLVMETLNAHTRTAALHAAIELNVFGALGQGAAEAGVLAERCGTSVRGMRILCDYLTIIGLMDKSDGVYSHTPTSAVFLDPASPASLARTAGFLGLPVMREVFNDLATIVRTGRTTMPGAGTVEPDNPIWVEFAHSMAPMMAPMAGPLAQIVLEGVTGPVRVLDIAAGHGLFGLGVARQNAEAHIVALDWPKVLEVAAQNAKQAGVEGRYSLLPGSAFEVDYGTGFDVVLLTNFLHHFDVETCVGLLKKVKAALKPGGQVAVLEFVPNDDRVTPPATAGFSMMMLASTERGDAYTFRELESMHRAAGFSEVTSHPLPMGAHTVVVGR